MRGAIRHAAGSAVFVLGLLALLHISSVAFAPKNNSRESGIIDSSANGFLSEKQDTIDVLILGDSESYCSFVPAQLWRDYGLTSYVCGTSQQKLCYTEEFLHKALERQSPKIVILEANAMYRKVSFEDGASQNAVSAFSIFRYHDRWKHMSLKDFSSPVRYTHIESSKGYRYNNSVKATPADRMEKYMKPTDEIAEISATNRKYVEAISEYCREHGTKLIFVSAPSSKNWNYRRHNGVAELAEKLGVEYIDMNLMTEQVPINWEKDTRDKGDHLNYYGAVKVTDYIGKYLADKKGFADHRSDKNYKEWQTASEEFYRQIEE